MNTDTALDAKQCYAAMLARDRRFDGKFFVAVASTKIYCRPICTVKPPLLRNCSFVHRAAHAEAKGFRPCLRCRPELAPGVAKVDAAGRLARRAAQLFEQVAQELTSVSAVATQLGVSDRHLRRVFEKEFGVSPIQYAQTRRLLNAKQLLSDTVLPVIQVALGSGFSSLRRFNATFQEHYRMSPTRLRKDSEASEVAKDCLQFRLAYRPPYAWREMMVFYSQRILPGVDEVAMQGESDANTWEYRRSCWIRDEKNPAFGWIRVRHNASRYELLVDVSSSLADHCMAVLQTIKRMFDLNAEPELIDEDLRKSGFNNLVPGLRLPGAVEPFECAVRAVLGQQVTVKAATTLSGRLLNLCDERFGLATQAKGFSSPWSEISRVFPSPQQFAQLSLDDIASQGIVSARAKALLGLAQAWSSCADEALDIHFAPGGDANEAAQALMRIPGIGEWTAQYVCMRALNWPDSFLAKDVVVLKALGLYPAMSVQRASRLASSIGERLAPWRSYAVLQLWHGAVLKVSDKK